jgi:hypothetical protein
MNNNIQYNQEDFMHVTSLRHKMHISRNATEYTDMLEQIQSDIMELSKTYQVDPVRLITVDPVDTCCDNDDCGGYDCSECDEVYEEAVMATKHDNNRMIEEWMTSVEQALDLPENEICPTGNARYDWVMRG